MQLEALNMAASRQLSKAKLHLHVCLQGVECFLNAARLAPSSLVIPMRTKKRGFTPHSAFMKFNSSEEQQKHFRAAGIVIPEEEMKRPFNITCTGGIFDPYVPPEGDARMSPLSKEGIKQKTQHIRQTVASQLAIRKIKECDPDFRIKTFAEKAQEIFIDAHSNLANFNELKLHSLVTERCYPEMTRGNRYKTIRWSFLESLEPPRVVQVRCPSMVSKDNVYGQVTVRMHTRQTLAIYDQFGRLMYGGEQIPRDVLEYIVFEKHLKNRYGQWRIHDKIVPSWAPPKDPIIKTVMIPGPAMTPSQEYEDGLDHQEPAAPQT